MSDTKSESVALVKAILEAWKNRDNSKLVQGAGALTFWQDGMLKYLDEIAENRAAPETFSELRKQYDQSERGVKKAINGLILARNKLAGTPVSRQIDRILHCNSSGKMDIRLEIDLLLNKREHLVSEHSREWDGKEMLKELADEAAHVCRMIRIFNGEVERLSRMVNEA